MANRAFNQCHWLYSSVTLAFLKVLLQGQRGYYSLLSELIQPSIDMQGIGMTGCLWVLTLPFSSDAGCGCLTRHLSIVQTGEKRGYSLRIKHCLILGPKHVCYMSRDKAKGRQADRQGHSISIGSCLTDLPVFRSNDYVIFAGVGCSFFSLQWEITPGSLLILSKVSYND